MVLFTVIRGLFFIVFSSITCFFAQFKPTPNIWHHQPMTNVGQNRNASPCREGGWMSVELTLGHDTSVSGHHGEHSLCAQLLCGLRLNKQAESVSCSRTDGCLQHHIQPTAYVGFSEMEINRCNLELHQFWSQLKRRMRMGGNQATQWPLCRTSRQVNWRGSLLFLIEPQSYLWTNGRQREPSGSQ